MQEDVEAEMRRLKQELKQTMDMYSTACKEALTAKQKVCFINSVFYNREKTNRKEVSEYFHQNVIVGTGASSLESRRTTETGGGTTI